MKPTETKAWACGCCRKTYTFNEHGKDFAESCCKCKNEGCNNQTAYTGRGNICDYCHKKDWLETAKKQAINSQETYDRALKDFQSLESRMKNRDISS